MCYSTVSKDCFPISGPCSEGRGLSSQVARCHSWYKSCLLARSHGSPLHCSAGCKLDRVVDAFYYAAGITSERERVAAVMVATFDEGSVGTGCKDGGDPWALAICWFGSGDSE